MQHCRSRSIAATTNPSECNSFAPNRRDAILEKGQLYGKPVSNKELQRVIHGNPWKLNSDKGFDEGITGLALEFKGILGVGVRKEGRAVLYSAAAQIQRKW
jgi:hypothetical protein